MKRCSMQKKKIESLKKNENSARPYMNRLYCLVENGYLDWATIGEYLARGLSEDMVEKAYGWMKQDELIPTDDALEEEGLEWDEDGELVTIANYNGDINSDESKKNESGIRYVPLKEIRSWLRDPAIKAVDISDWTHSQCRALKNNHNLDTICISTGTYGPTGGVFEDEDGTYYVCTRRSSGLAYLAP